MQLSKSPRHQSHHPGLMSTHHPGRAAQTDCISHSSSRNLGARELPRGQVGGSPLPTPSSRQTLGQATPTPIRAPGSRKRSREVGGGGGTRRRDSHITAVSINASWAESSRFGCWALGSAQAPFINNFIVRHQQGRHVYRAKSCSKNFTQNSSFHHHNHPKKPVLLLTPTHR